MPTASLDAAGKPDQPDAARKGGILGSTADPGEPDIPDKLYFRIGEVSKLADVPQYVLRYWESEFPGLSPKKSGRNHRLYRRKDVELILEVKRLLYVRRFTIEGARKFLETKVKETPPKRKPERQAALFDLGEPGAMSRETIAGFRDELRSILKLLK